MPFIEQKFDPLPDLKQLPQKPSLRPRSSVRLKLVQSNRIEQNFTLVKQLSDRTSATVHNIQSRPRSNMFQRKDNQLKELVQMTELKYKELPQISIKQTQAEEILHPIEQQQIQKQVIKLRKLVQNQLHSSNFYNSPFYDLNSVVHAILLYKNGEIQASSVILAGMPAFIRNVIIEMDSFIAVPWFPSIDKVDTMEKMIDSFNQSFTNIFNMVVVDIRKFDVSNYSTQIQFYICDRNGIQTELGHIQWIDYIDQQNVVSALQNKKIVQRCYLSSYFSAWKSAIRQYKFNRVKSSLVNNQIERKLCDNHQILSQFKQQIQIIKPKFVFVPSYQQYAESLQLQLEKINSAIMNLQVLQNNNRSVLGILFSEFLVDAAIDTIYTLFEAFLVSQEQCDSHVISQKEILHSSSACCTLFNINQQQILQVIVDKNCIPLFYLDFSQVVKLASLIDELINRIIQKFNVTDHFTVYLQQSNRYSTLCTTISNAVMSLQTTYSNKFLEFKATVNSVTQSSQQILDLPETLYNQLFDQVIHYLSISKTEHIINFCLSVLDRISCTLYIYQHSICLYPDALIKKITQFVQTVYKNNHDNVKFGVNLLSNFFDAVIQQYSGQLNLIQQFDCEELVDVSCLSQDLVKPDHFDLQIIQTVLNKVKLTYDSIQAVVQFKEIMFNVQKIGEYFEFSHLFQSEDCQKSFTQIKMKFQDLISVQSGFVDYYDEINCYFDEIQRFIVSFLYQVKYVNINICSAINLIMRQVNMFPEMQLNEFYFQIAKLSIKFNMILKLLQRQSLQITKNQQIIQQICYIIGIFKQQKQFSQIILQYLSLLQFLSQLSYHLRIVVQQLVSMINYNQMLSKSLFVNDNKHLCKQFKEFQENISLSVVQFQTLYNQAKQNSLIHTLLNIDYLNSIVSKFQSKSGLLFLAQQFCHLSQTIFNVIPTTISRSTIYKIWQLFPIDQEHEFKFLSNLVNLNLVTQDLDILFNFCKGSDYQDILNFKQFEFQGQFVCNIDITQLPIITDFEICSQNFQSALPSSMSQVYKQLNDFSQYFQLLSQSSIGNNFCNDHFEALDVLNCSFSRLIFRGLLNKSRFERFIIICQNQLQQSQFNSRSSQVISQFNNLEQLSIHLSYTQQNQPQIDLLTKIINTLEDYIIQCNELRSNLYVECEQIDNLQLQANKMSLIKYQVAILIKIVSIYDRFYEMFSCQSTISKMLDNYIKSYLITIQHSRFFNNFKLGDLFIYQNDIEFISKQTDSILKSVNELLSAKRSDWWRYNFISDETLLKFLSQQAFQQKFTSMMEFDQKYVFERKIQSYLLKNLFYNISDVKFSKNMIYASNGNTLVINVEKIISKEGEVVSIQPYPYYSDKWVMNLELAIINQLKRQLFTLFNDKQSSNFYSSITNQELMLNHYFETLDKVPCQIFILFRNILISNFLQQCQSKDKSTQVEQTCQQQIIKVREFQKLLTQKIIQKINYYVFESNMIKVKILQLVLDNEFNIEVQLRNLDQIIIFRFDEYDNLYLSSNFCQTEQFSYQFEYSGLNRLYSQDLLNLKQQCQILNLATQGKNFCYFLQSNDDLHFHQFVRHITQLCGYPLKQLSCVNSVSLYQVTRIMETLDSTPIVLTIENMDCLTLDNLSVLSQKLLTIKQKLLFQEFRQFNQLCFIRCNKSQSQLHLQTQFKLVQLLIEPSYQQYISNFLFGIGFYNSVKLACQCKFIFEALENQFCEINVSKFDVLNILNLIQNAYFSILQSINSQQIKQRIMTFDDNISNFQGYLEQYLVARTIISYFMLQQTSMLDQVSEFSTKQMPFPSIFQFLKFTFDSQLIQQVIKDINDMPSSSFILSQGQASQMQIVRFQANEQDLQNINDIQIQQLSNFKDLKIDQMNNDVQLDKLCLLQIQQYLSLHYLQIFKYDAQNSLQTTQLPIILQRDFSFQFYINNFLQKCLKYPIFVGNSIEIKQFQQLFPQYQVSYVYQIQQILNNIVLNDTNYFLFIFEDQCLMNQVLDCFDFSRCLIFHSEKIDLACKNIMFLYQTSTEEQCEKFISIPFSIKLNYHYNQQRFVFYDYLKSFNISSLSNFSILQNNRIDLLLNVIQQQKTLSIAEINFILSYSCPNCQQQQFVNSYDIIKSLAIIFELITNYQVIDQQSLQAGLLKVSKSPYFLSDSILIEKQESDKQIVRIPLILFLQSQQKYYREIIIKGKYLIQFDNQIVMLETKNLKKLIAVCRIITNTTIKQVVVSGQVSYQQYTIIKNLHHFNPVYMECQLQQNQDLDSLLHLVQFIQQRASSNIVIFLKIEQPFQQRLLQQLFINIDQQQQNWIQFIINVDARIYQNKYIQYIQLDNFEQSQDSYLQLCESFCQCWLPSVVTQQFLSQLQLLVAALLHTLQLNWHGTQILFQQLYSSKLQHDNIFLEQLVLILIFKFFECHYEINLKYHSKQYQNYFIQLIDSYKLEYLFKNSVTSNHFKYLVMKGVSMIKTTLYQKFESLKTEIIFKNVNLSENEIKQPYLDQLINEQQILNSVNKESDCLTILYQQQLFSNYLFHQTRTSLLVSSSSLSYLQDICSQFGIIFVQFINDDIFNCKLLLDVLQSEQKILICSEKDFSFHEYLKIISCDISLLQELDLLKSFIQKNLQQNQSFDVFVDNLLAKTASIRCILRTTEANQQKDPQSQIMQYLFDEILTEQYLQTNDQQEKQSIKILFDILTHANFDKQISVSLWMQYLRNFMTKKEQQSKESLRKQQQFCDRFTQKQLILQEQRTKLLQSRGVLKQACVDLKNTIFQIEEKVSAMQTKKSQQSAEILAKEQDINLIEKQRQQIFRNYSTQLSEAQLSLQSYCDKFQHFSLLDLMELGSQSNKQAVQLIVKFILVITKLEQTQENSNLILSDIKYFKQIITNFSQQLSNIQINQIQAISESAFLKEDKIIYNKLIIQDLVRFLKQFTIYHCLVLESDQSTSVCDKNLKSFNLQKQQLLNNINEIQVQQQQKCSEMLLLQNKYDQYQSQLGELNSQFEQIDKFLEILSSLSPIIKENQQLCCYIQESLNKFIQFDMYDKLASWLPSFNQDSFIPYIAKVLMFDQQKKYMFHFLDDNYLVHIFLKNFKQFSSYVDIQMFLSAKATPIIFSNKKHNLIFDVLKFFQCIMVKDITQLNDCEYKQTVVIQLSCISELKQNILSKLRTIFSIDFSFGKIFSNSQLQFIIVIEDTFIGDTKQFDFLNQSSNFINFQSETFLIDVLVNLYQNDSKQSFHQFLKENITNAQNLQQLFHNIDISDLTNQNNDNLLNRIQYQFNNIKFIPFNGFENNKLLKLYHAACKTNLFSSSQFVNASKTFQEKKLFEQFMLQTFTQNESKQIQFKYILQNLRDHINGKNDDMLFLYDSMCIAIQSHQCLVFRNYDTKSHSQTIQQHDFIKFQFSKQNLNKLINMANIQAVNHINLLHNVVYLAQGLSRSKSQDNYCIINESQFKQVIEILSQDSKMEFFVPFQLKNFQNQLILDLTMNWQSIWVQLITQEDDFYESRNQKLISQKLIKQIAETIINGCNSGDISINNIIKNVFSILLTKLFKPENFEFAIQQFIDQYQYVLDMDLCSNNTVSLFQIHEKTDVSIAINYVSNQFDDTTLQLLADNNYQQRLQVYKQHMKTKNRSDINSMVIDMLLPSKATLVYFNPYQDSFQKITQLLIDQFETKSVYLIITLQNCQFLQFIPQINNLLSLIGQIANKFPILDYRLFLVSNMPIQCDEIMLLRYISNHQNNIFTQIEQILTDRIVLYNKSVQLKHINIDLYCNITKAMIKRDQCYSKISESNLEEQSYQYIDLFASNSSNAEDSLFNQYLLFNNKNLSQTRQILFKLKNYFNNTNKFFLDLNNLSTIFIHSKLHYNIVKNYVMLQNKQLFMPKIDYLNVKCWTYTTYPILQFILDEVQLLNKLILMFNQNEFQTISQLKILDDQSVYSIYAKLVSTREYLQQIFSVKHIATVEINKLLRPQLFISTLFVQACWQYQVQTQDVQLVFGMISSLTSNQLVISGFNIKFANINQNGILRMSASEDNFSKLYVAVCIKCGQKSLYLTLLNQNYEENYSRRYDESLCVTNQLLMSATTGFDAKNKQIQDQFLGSLNLENSDSNSLRKKNLLQSLSTTPPPDKLLLSTTGQPVAFVHMGRTLLQYVFDFEDPDYWATADVKVMI